MMNRILVILILLFCAPALAQTKLSSISPGGAYNPITDKVVTVRSGSQDVLTTAGAGTVTSVGITGDGVLYNSSVTGSPVTSSGAFSPSLLTQTANKIFAGPASGSAAIPGFRALVAADVFTTVNCTGGASPAACGAFYGYSNPLWYGATCNGSADDSSAINSASAAAVMGGWNKVHFPSLPFKCSTISQIETPSGTNGFVWEWPQGNTTYNGNVPNATTMHINSNCGGGSCWFSANNCGFDVNGTADTTFINPNFLGDGGNIGTTAVCNSTNTMTSNEPQPRVNIINGSESQMAAMCCASLTKTGITGLATPFTGTGSTASNLITLKAIGTMRCNEGAVCLTGNISDAGSPITLESAGNECGDVVGVNSGAVNIRLAGRFENMPGTGVSGMCGAHGPNVEVTGSGWTMLGQIINNNGPAFYFDKAYANFTWYGLLSGNGSAGVSGAESEIVLNGAAGIHGSISLYGAFAQTGITSPAYFVQSLSTANGTLNVFGDMTGAYTSARDLNTTGTITYNTLLATGESNQITGNLQINGTTPTINASAAELTLKQSGDSDGATSCTIENAITGGTAGLSCVNAGLDLWDNVFAGNSGAVSHWRFEHRSGSLQNAGNTTGEFQAFLGSTLEDFFGGGAGLISGHIGNALGLTSAPTCGTGCASITAGSTDSRGSFVTSASITSSILNFGTTWSGVPVCVISDSSTAAVVDINSVTTGALTVNFANSLSGATVYYVCIQ